MVINVFFDKTYTVLLLGLILPGEQSVAQKREGIQQNRFAHRIDNVWVGADALIPEILHLITIGEKEIVTIDAQIIQQHISPDTDEADIHISQVLIGLNGKGVSGEGEKDIPLLDGRDTALGVQVSFTGADIIHLINRLGPQMVTLLRFGLQNEAYRVDGVQILLKRYKMADILIHSISPFPDDILRGFSR